jgi:C1A family cysteine protease
MRSSFVFAVLLGLLALVCATPPVWLKHGDQAVFHQFTKYMADFKKSYETDQEKAKRFVFYKENMDKAAVLNDLHNGTAKFGPTIFSDLSVEEFAQKYLSSIVNPPEANSNISKPLLRGAAPSSIDWTAQGKVTAVKDQGQVCGSCWAFTATGEMESQLLIKGRGTYQLSVQQLVDCDPYDTGCAGGFYDRAWQYISQAGGVMNWADYTYQGAKYSCRFNSGKVAARLSSSMAQKSGTLAGDIYNFVSSHGPSAAALDATPLQNYQSGILNMSPSYCGNLNHAVLITGYNQATSPPSLVVRNSWGTWWGEKGYFRISPTSCLINQHVMGSWTM